MSDKTPTERLRELLEDEEREVKYRKSIVTEGVLFTVSTGNECYYILVRDSDAGIEMWSQYFTPEQAVEATLGRGTCRLDEVDIDGESASDYMKCREWCFDAVYACSCGCRFGYAAHDRPRYCPHCGAEVIDA